MNCVFFKCAVIKFIKVQKKFSFKKKYHTNPSFPFVLTKFHVNFECPPYFLEWHKGQKITQKKADNKEWQIIFHISFIWPIPIWRNFMLIWTEYHVFWEWQRPKKWRKKRLNDNKGQIILVFLFLIIIFHPDSQQPVTIVELYRFSTGTHVLLNLMIYAHSFVLTRTRNDC